MKFSTVLLLLFSLSFMNSTAQNDLKSFSFKKGEVLDIILLSTAPNSGALFERYKKTAFPVGFEYTYQPQPGFKTTELTLGNHLPTSLILGKWSSKEKREGFLTTITKRVPDFHSQRRALFTYFGLTYYVAPRDIQFSVDTKKYNLATSFWKKDSKSFSSFLTQWKKEVIKSGGKIILQLQDGTSPTGYDYNPDIFYIIEWKDESSFETFAKKHPLSSYEVLKNVHQLVID
ncbi:hypothetical protein [Aquimarina longa]|uniref:hypothetical protein n=1 Tax=Aquimarina longa TaxID=1080221 RepID=UPI000785BC0F|nr:hypothetical protein [Aquimarina longa]